MQQRPREITQSMSAIYKRALFSKNLDSALTPFLSSVKTTQASKNKIYFINCLCGRKY